MSKDPTDIIGQLLAGALMSGDAKVITASRRDDSDNGAETTIDPEVQIMRLREVLDRYENEFKVGDLVTPRRESGLKYHGLSHLVIEVGDHYAWDVEETGNSGFGARMNVRVACMPTNDYVVMFWQESWKLRPYDGNPE